MEIQEMRVEVQVQYIAPYFNRVAYCNIPGHYAFEVVDAAEVMGERRDGILRF